jgi:hypothetical protein
MMAANVKPPDFAGLFGHTADIMGWSWGALGSMFAE